MARNILVEVSPIDKASGLPVTIRMSAAHADATGVNVDSKVWFPVVAEWPKRNTRLFSEGSPQEIEIEHGDITFNCDAQFNNLAWSNYVWAGALGRVWIGEMGAAFSSYTQIFEGSFGPLRRKAGQAQVTLLGAEAALDRQILSQSYLGTGSTEGNANLRGVLKPWASGYCKNVEPILIDPVSLTYQVHGYGPIESIEKTYENALDLGLPVNDYPTFAALTAASLAEGTWATCLPAGMFRLASEPSGKVTADVRGAKDGSTYVSSVSAISRHLMKVAGLTTGQMDAATLNIFSSVEWNLFSRSQITVGEAVRSAYNQAGGYLYPSKNGVWKAGDWFASQTPGTLKADQSALPLVRAHEQLEAAPAFYRVKVGGDRCYAVHTANEISQFLTTAEDQVARDAAEEARAIAEAAQQDAEKAIERLTNFTNDDIIDRAEKSQIIREINRINSEYTGIYNSAVAVGLSAEALAFESAKNQLTAYVSGLTPALDDLTADTVVDGATISARFNNYYSARQNLLNKIAVQGALAGYLTNEMDSVIADSTGAVTAAELATVTGTFKVFSGLLDVTANCTFAIVSKSNIDLTINATTGAYVLTAITADSGYAELRANYGTTSINKMLSVTKSKPGANGAPAKSLMVSSDRQTISYTGSGVADPSVQTTTFTATKQNSTSTVNWSITDALGTAKTPTTSFLSSATGDSVTMTEAQFAAARGTSSGVIVTAQFTDGTLLIDRISVTRVASGATGSNGVDGSSPMVAMLSNPSHTVQADATGLVGSFAGAGGQMRLFEGATERTSAASYSVVNQTGVVMAINSTGAYSVTSMSADQGSATLRATLGSVSRDVVYSIAKSRIGADGAPAKMIVVTSSMQTFSYAAGATTPTPQTTLFNATRQNTMVATTWKLFKLDGTTAVTVSPTYLTVNGDAASMTHTQFHAFCQTENTSGVIVAGEFTDGGKTFTDRISVIKVADGANGSSPLVSVLTNPTHTVPADAAGVVSSFATAGGSMRVFEGQVERTSAATFSVASSSGVTISINAAGAYSVSAMSADIGTATLRASYAGFTRDVVYTITKSKSGANGQAGAAAKSVILTSSHVTFQYISGSGTPNSQTTVLKALRQNTSVSTTWRIFKADGATEVALNASYITVNGDDATISHVQFNDFLAAQATSGIVVMAQFSDGITFSDRINIVAVRDGSTGGRGLTGDKGDKGDKGDPGQTGAAGMPAILYRQDQSPSGMAVGATWYRPTYKDWYQWDGSQWVKLLGAMSSFDVVTADRMSVVSLAAITQNVGTFVTSDANGSTTLTGTTTTVRNAQNQMTFRSGLW